MSGVSVKYEHLWHIMYAHHIGSLISLLDSVFEGLEVMSMFELLYYWSMLSGILSIIDKSGRGSPHDSPFGCW